MHTRTSATAAAASLLLAACSQATPPQAETAQRPRLERAGQPVDPLKTAGHITGARVAALTGDQDGVRRNIEAMSDDMRRAMKLADAARPIDREAARAAARTVPGVRSVAWVDRSNLLVRVDSNARRSHQLIDEVCYQLQPLGDTLAVVVNVQSTAARTPDELDTLSRNCQLAPGDRALLQRERQLDVLDPAIRAQYRANAEHMRAQQRRKQDAGDRAALEAIPEM